MGLLKEFKDFAMRGSVVDLAVGVIIGAAFGKIVNSLVADVIMPPIGYLIGGVKFTELKANLPAITIKVPDPESPGSFMDKTLEAVTVNYGNFLQTTFDFLIVAACVFLMVKIMNILWKKKVEDPKPKELTMEEKLLTEIRDLLKSKPA